MINVSINRVQLVREPAHKYNIEDRSMRAPFKVNVFCREVLEMDKEPEEVCYAIYTDAHNKLNGVLLISRGNLRATPVSIAAIVRGALLHNAYGIILTHNHPTGNPEPSRDDIRMTKKVEKAAALFDIKLRDHVIIGDEDFVSLAERGVCNPN